MEAEAAFLHSIDGTARLRRIGRFRFPTEELVADGRTVAQLGRDGSLRVFLGRGRRVRLADGTEWRVKAIKSGPYIVPVISSRVGLAGVSAPLSGKRSYGINTKGYGCVLVPASRVGLTGVQRWRLRRHDVEAGEIEEHGRMLAAHEPIPIAVVLLAFSLITHGVPGEAKLRPSQD